MAGLTNISSNWYFNFHFHLSSNHSHQCYISCHGMDRIIFIFMITKYNHLHESNSQNICRMQQLNNAVMSPFLMVNGFFIKVERNLKWWILLVMNDQCGVSLKIQTNWNVQNINDKHEWSKAFPSGYKQPLKRNYKWKTMNVFIWVNTSCLFKLLMIDIIFLNWHPSP